MARGGDGDRNGNFAVVLFLNEGCATKKLDVHMWLCYVAEKGFPFFQDVTHAQVFQFAP